ncbi:unnamed protein product [Knipowitschia caucasica]
MYYLQLEKEPLYPPQSRFVPGPQYQDFGYHHHHHVPPPEPPHGAWSAAYGTAAVREDWAYGHGAHGAHGGHTHGAHGGHTHGAHGAHGAQGTVPGSPPLSVSTSAAPGLGFSSADFPLTSVSGPGPALPSLPPGPPPLSPDSPQRRTPYEWIRRNNPPTNPNGKTRTKDKYRVVYTDHQRLELEKEFHYSKYITIRRKAELASQLSLSERQVKIWFQNRRAKERKMNKKKQQQPASSTTTPPGNSSHAHSNSNAMVTSSINIKEEF